MRSEDEYLQKFQTTYTQKDGLIENDVKTLGRVDEFD